MNRFDDAYGKVYDGNGEFLFSYYECGIEKEMSEDRKNELADERKDYLLFAQDEENFQKEGLT